MLTEDTLRRLEQKQEELALLFLEQTSVEGWRDLSTKEQRGDVYWYKRNCGETMTLIVRIQSLLNMSLRLTGRDRLPLVPPEAAETDEATTDALMERAEKDAVAMIERVRTRKK